MIFLKFCPKCNACNSNDAEKCFKCNYLFSSDNRQNNTIASIDKKSDNKNNAITFELINYEKYQKNLATLYSILQNNKPVQFEVHISSVTHEVRFFVNNMKIGSVPQDKTKYFLQENVECKINNVSIANKNNLLIPSISVICSKKQPEPNTNQQSSNSNTTIQTSSENKSAKDNLMTDNSNTTIQTSTENTETTHTNAIAIAIRVIAVLTYICGFFVGFVILKNGSSFFNVAIICWIASLIIGTFILGFSEIIQLLDEIKNKK